MARSTAPTLHTKKRHKKPTKKRQKSQGGDKDLQKKKKKKERKKLGCNGHSFIHAAGVGAGFGERRATKRSVEGEEGVGCGGGVGGVWCVGGGRRRNVEVALRESVDGVGCTRWRWRVGWVQGRRYRWGLLWCLGGLVSRGRCVQRGCGGGGGWGERVSRGRVGGGQRSWGYVLRQHRGLVRGVRPPLEAARRRAARSGRVARRRRPRGGQGCRGARCLRGRPR